MTNMYGPWFFEKVQGGAATSAERILSTLLGRFAPTSIVDVGCGVASWLSVARRLGVTDVVGVDGAWVPRSALLIPPEQFVECDLASSAPQLSRRFDMCLSTEVAEHLPPERSEAFVDLLCGLSDVVVFSAAVPGQGGINHVNERWQSYWVAQFRRNGYGVLDLVRPMTWTDENVEPWYRQNLLVFVADCADEAVFVDIVHPYFVERTLARRSTLVRQVRKTLRPARAAVARLVSRTRRRTFDDNSW